MAGDRKDETVGPPEDLQDQLVEQIIANLRRVYDPELNLNVYDLGLIYSFCSGSCDSINNWENE